MNKLKNYETVLPENYVLVKHVDAKKDKKLAQKLALFSYLPLFILVPILCLIANYVTNYNIIKNWKNDKVLLVILIAIAINFIYVILHELTHGITYKILTGGKLTFGYAITVAFCGMPNLYVRRKASIASLIMPFIVFGVIFLGLTIGLWFIKPLFGIAAGFVLALHIGGCSGDLYWLILFESKFKHCNTLRKDNGSEQWLYISKEEAIKYNIKEIDN